MIKNTVFRRSFPILFAAVAFSPAITRADDDDAIKSPAIPTPDSQPAPAAGWLNPRSGYYHDAFPEPFRVEDTTLNNEFRLDYQYTQSRAGISHLTTAEVQKSLGIVTFDFQASYISGPPAADDNAALRQLGFGSIALGGRLPIYQFVSESAGIDNTIGFNLEVGLPTNSRVSKHTEIAAGVFHDLRLGSHFTIQSLFSVSSLLGSPPEEGREALEYGISLGYSIEDEELALPAVERFTPIFELVGETALAGTRPGHDSLTATAGLRFEMKSVGPLQPQLGIAYLFPIDQGGREEMKWGMIVSLDFEF